MGTLRVAITEGSGVILEEEAIRYLVMGDLSNSSNIRYKIKEVTVMGRPPATIVEIKEKACRLPEKTQSVMLGIAILKAVISNSSQLAAMGPPIRSGFGNYAVQSPAIPPPDHPQNNSYQVHNPNVNGHQHQQGSYGNQRQPYNRPNGNFPGHRGQKRPHGDAFEQSGSRKPQIMAPPAVPSFGSPLAIHPQQSVVETEKTPKKKRKYNQLGLTPQGEEHESSEEEEEIDEESKLAAAHGVGSNQSQLYSRSCELGELSC